MKSLAKAAFCSQKIGVKQMHNKGSLTSTIVLKLIKPTQSLFYYIQKLAYWISTGPKHSCKMFIYFRNKSCGLLFHLPMGSPRGCVFLRMHCTFMVFSTAFFYSLIKQQCWSSETDFIVTVIACIYLQIFAQILLSAVSTCSAAKEDRRYWVPL